MLNWHKHENLFITLRPGHAFFVFTPYAYMSSSSYLVGARGLRFCTSIHLHVRHINVCANSVCAGGKSLNPCFVMKS